MSHQWWWRHCYKSSVMSHWLWVIGNSHDVTVMSHRDFPWVIRNSPWWRHCGRTGTLGTTWRYVTTCVQTYAGYKIHQLWYFVLYERNSSVHLHNNWAPYIHVTYQTSTSTGSICRCRNNVLFCDLCITLKILMLSRWLTTCLDLVDLLLQFIVLYY